jgi:hypothetical protein
MAITAGRQSAYTRARVPIGCRARQAQRVFIPGTLPPACDHRVPCHLIVLLAHTLVLAERRCAVLMSAGVEVVAVFVACAMLIRAAAQCGVYTADHAVDGSIMPLTGARGMVAVRSKTGVGRPAPEYDRDRSEQLINCHLTISIAVGSAVSERR